MRTNKIELEEIKNVEIEKFLEKFDWRFFEDFVTKIFEANDFEVERKIIFVTARKHEIDVIAKNPRFFPFR